MLKLSKGVNLTELIREAIADQKRPKYGHCLKGIDVNIIPKCFGDIFSDVCVCVCVCLCVRRYLEPRGLETSGQRAYH